VRRRLDGIPLAIELAAARSAILGVTDLCARLNDQFRLLTGGFRTALPRHRTLRATLDWSYDLLSEAEQAILRSLAIFAGSFSLEGACRVAANIASDVTEIIDGVSNLASKSLLTVQTSESGTSYRLLETTRAYARR
jgi:predicted ATPase